MNKTPYSVEDLKEKLRSQGFFVFTSGEMNLNIVGVRSECSRPNYFDDELHVFWENEYSKTSYHCSWPITTYPGTPYLIKPMNQQGTAILVPGQYRSTYQLGTYKGYTALKQVRPVCVYRDTNCDEAFDEDPASIDEGMFGIHIHKAGIFSKLVGPNSAGCQVFQSTADFERFIAICESAKNFWGNMFTYTLIEAS